MPSRNNFFDQAPRAGVRYVHPARQADALSWNSRAQIVRHPAPQPVAGRRHLPKRCFGSGCARPVATPYRTPTLSQRKSVPCASSSRRAGFPTRMDRIFNPLIKGVFLGNGHFNRLIRSGGRLLPVQARTAEEVKPDRRPGEQDAARAIDDLELQGAGAPIDVLKMEFGLADRRGAGNAIEEELEPVSVLYLGIDTHQDGEGAGIAAYRGIVSGGEDLGAGVGIHCERGRRACGAALPRQPHSRGPWLPQGLIRQSAGLSLPHCFTACSPRVPHHSLGPKPRLCAAAEKKHGEGGPGEKDCRRPRCARLCEKCARRSSTSRIPPDECWNSDDPPPPASTPGSRRSWNRQTRRPPSGSRGRYRAPPAPVPGNWRR